MMKEAFSVEGDTLRVSLPGREPEEHECDAAEARLSVIREGLTWVGTPFRDCGDVKGPKGAVDCAMFLVRTHVDTGQIPPFDPRPYSPRHMMHSSKQEFLGWIVDRLGGVPTDDPKPGDVVLWQFGRCFSHGGLVLGSRDVLHAYGAAGMVLVSSMDESLLDRFTFRGIEHRRPRAFYRMGRR